MKLDILLSGDEVDALSFIVHKDKAYGLARGLCDKLKEIIPRQLFECPSRVLSATRSLPVPPSKRGARTCLPSVTAAISRVSANCSRSRRGQEAHEGHRLGRGSLRRPLWRSSRWTSRSMALSEYSKRLLGAYAEQPFLIIPWRA